MRDFLQRGTMYLEMKTADLIDLPPEVAAKRPEEELRSSIPPPGIEADYSGWTTGLPEDPGETPPPIITAIRAAITLAVIGLIYLIVRYFAAN